jgi:adenosylcobinamide kinase/adenosylcobinamide-phosphate guanylyltransferase
VLVKILDRKVENMAKIIFVTGGTQSGKVRWAVSYLGSMDDVMYMCAYDRLETSIAERIEFHCKKNAINWSIQTGARELHKLVKGRKFAILDNLGEYANRTIREKGYALAEITREQRIEIEKQVSDEITELIWEIKETNGTLVIVTVEVGLGSAPAESEQEMYRTILGNINQRVAHLSTEVYLMVSGIPSKIK